MKLFCWTDSLDCLFCIHNTKKNWKQFIQTRVLKIRDTLQVGYFAQGCRILQTFPQELHTWKMIILKSFGWRDLRFCHCLRKIGQAQKISKIINLMSHII